MASSVYDRLLKLLLIGDGGVGKTCILLRYVDETFRTTFISTVGIDFKLKTLEINGKRIRLQIWDTAGQERFRSITTSHYKGAKGIMLVFDVTQEESFHSITNWLKAIDMNASSDVERLLVGNKCDLESKRAVRYETIQEMAETHNISYIETSARSNHNIDKAFEMLVRQILKKVNDKDLAGCQDNVLHLQQQQQANRKKCSC